MSTVQSIERAFAVLRSLIGRAGRCHRDRRPGRPAEEHGVAVAVDARRTRRGRADRAGRRLPHRCRAWSRSAAAARPGRSLIAAARPHLAELATRHRRSGRAVDRRRHRHALPRSGEPRHRAAGARLDRHRIPMHAVPVRSGGAGRSTGDRCSTRYLAGAPGSVHRRTPSSTPAPLRSRLAEVAAKGYAWAFEEFADGLNSVAAPIRDAGGRVVGAVARVRSGVSLPRRARRRRVGRSWSTQPPGSASTEHR